MLNTDNVVKRRLPNNDNTRNSQIQSFLFPDVDDSSFGGQQREINSSLNRLSKPTTRLKFIVSNFTDYLDDTNAAVDCTPNLLKMLQNPNDGEQLKALEFIHNLCRKQASRLGLASQIKLIDILKSFVVNERDLEKRSHALSSLQHMSKGKQGAGHIVNVGLIPYILKLLKNEDKKTLECAVSILDNVLHFVEKCRELVRSHEGVDLLVRLLDYCTDVKLITVILDCLYKLTYRHPESKIVMLTSRGSEKVVQMMRQYTYEKLLFTASKLLKVLSVCNSNKPILVESGGLEALGIHLQSKSPRLVQSCLWSIRNLSDHSAHLSGMDKTIGCLIDLLSSEQLHEAICAIGCLCNFTAGNKENKISFIEYGGVQAVCQLMCERINQEEIVEPGAGALRHVTYDNPKQNVAVKSILESPLLSNLAVLIRGQPDKMLPMIKALVGLIRNLAFSSPNCRKSLIDLGVTDSLCEIFTRTLAGMNDLAKQRNSIVSISSELSYVEGVRLEDLLELTLCALQALAKDDWARKIITYQNRLIQNVVQLVMVREYSPPLHRASLSLLAEIAEYRDNSKLMESEGFNTRLSELLNSSNRAIAIYAAVVIFFINNDKPQQHKDRIQQELAESLQRQYHQQRERDSMAPPTSDSIGNLSHNSKQPIILNYNNLPNIPNQEPLRSYDNRGYITDFDGPPSANVKYGRQSRQAQQFEDVEL